MEEEGYLFPENPIYTTEIRKFQNTDPVNAEEVVNPVIQKIVENIHALYLQKAAKEELNASTAELESAISSLETALEALNGKVENDITAALESLKKGLPGGVAPLDETGKVPDEYLNAQGGLVAGDTAPENTLLGWIDTGNGNVLKFYDGEQWVTVGAVWG